MDNFINNTSHFQINDARQLPIIIPQKETFESLQKLVADCISLKRTAVIDEILMEEKQYECCSICHESTDRIYDIRFRVNPKLQIPSEQLTKVCNKCVRQLEWMNLCILLNVLK